MSWQRGRQQFNRFNRKDRPRENFHSGPRHRNYDNKNQERSSTPQERLSEDEVGITEYIGTAPGFSGIIKARFSDFQVNEINPSGVVAKLTDRSAPANFNFDVVDEDPSVSRLELLPSETWDKLDEIVNSSSEQEVFVEFDVTTLSKEDRTNIHQNVKQVFGKRIVATTVVIDEKKLIRFKRYVKGDRLDSRWRWPKDTGEYVYFVVYKEVVDTLEATFKISDCLRMKSSLFSYAGVKDRRAKTTQWFCVKKVDPRKLVNKTRFLRNIHVGNISFHNKPLKLGQLSGNRFRIALRNVTAEDDAINDAMESLKTNGFINYYGLQRFGNDKEVPTHEIGIKLMQGNWKEACELILKPKMCEDPTTDIALAKRIYKDTSDAELASKQFTRNYNKCVESKLLLGFAKNHSNDCVNALENIPRNMRLLYIHAFQSFIWNSMASKRVKEFGLKPIVGDLVLVSEKTVEDEDVEESNGKDEADDGEKTTEEEEMSKTIQEVKVLGENDLDKYTIYDIVLPLPGYDIKYPENEVKNWYEAALAVHNLLLEMPKQKVKTYTLSGAYRNIVGEVKEFSWKTMKYNHPNDSLIRSDFEELEQQPEPKDDPQGQYKAIVVDFCLNSSHYATMVLREILKMDTSITAHAKLNKYHETSQFAASNSLLTDTEKYEAFKQQIFGESSEPLKRKIDDEKDEPNDIKKIKVVTENPEVSIKVQPSLV